ncbi:hypothetical protein TNCV_345381 [Trichonephila clavipes]|nr:hypothetical protein TNCV_345381 [Trichonephila clavipes]
MMCCTFPSSGSCRVATEIVHLSTRRWELLNRETKLKFTLRSLSQTRWSCHYDAVEALTDNYEKLILDLNTSQAYAECSKKFKFLDLQDQSKENIDLESVCAIIDYYSDDVDQHLVKEGIGCKTDWRN